MNSIIAIKKKLPNIAYTIFFIEEKSKRKRERKKKN